MKSSSLSREQDINFDINTILLFSNYIKSQFCFQCQTICFGIKCKIRGWGFLTHQEFFDTHFKALVIGQVEYNHLCMNW